MYTGRIKTGQPHVADNHQLQRIVRVLEALLQFLLLRLAVEVRLQGRLVRRTAGHHHPHRAIAGVVITCPAVSADSAACPVRAQIGNRLEHLRADIPAHAHDHGLACQGGGACLEMLDQVSGHFPDARLGPHQFFQRSPFALGTLTNGDIFFILDDFFDFLVELFDVRLVDIQLGQTTFVVDGHRRTIVHRILNVVDTDVVTEHRAGVLVFTGNGRTGKTDERGIGQGIAHVLGIAELVFTGLLIQHRLQPVLAAVGLVGDHHDIVPLAQHGMTAFIGKQGELLHRGKDDPTRLPRQ